VDKNDWYFVVSTMLALGAVGLTIITTDWTLAKGRIPWPQSGWYSLITLLIVCSLIFSGIGWYKAQHRNLVKYTMPRGKMKRVYGEVFRDKTVEVDGKRFDHCTFSGVRFVFHGTKPWEFFQVNFEHRPVQHITLTTDNEGIRDFMKLLSALHAIPTVTKGEYFFEDDKGNQIPMPITIAVQSGGKVS
jgi:hypothetical protein